MLSWMESRWRHQEGGGHPGQQYGEQQCCRWWCSCEMSDSNHSIPDKARPVRINANKSGMWAGMPGLLNPIFIFLSVNHPTQYWILGGNTRSRHGGYWGILLNWSPTIRHLKADNSPILYLEAVEAVKKLWLCAGVYATLFVSSAVSSQLCGTGPGSADRPRVRISCKSVLRGGRRVSDAPSATMDWQTASDTSRSV